MTVVLAVWEVQQLRRSGACLQSTKQCLKFGGPLFTELVGQCFVHAGGNIQVGRPIHFTEQLHSLFTMLEGL